MRPRARRRRPSREEFRTPRVEAETLEHRARPFIDLVEDHRAAGVSCGRDSAYGARCTPRSVTIAATSSPGVTSKAGFRAAKRALTSAGSRSSIGICGAGSGRRVEGRGRCDDHQRQAVVSREHRETVRADLVRRVAVRSDAVGAGHDDVDLAARHEPARRAVDDHRVGDPELLELPGGQPRALEERPRLVHPDVLDEPGLVCGPDRPERCPVAACCEAAGVAVRQHARTGRDELDRMLPHPPAALDLVCVDPLGALARRVVAHRVERPAEVDRRRPRRREHLGRGVEVVPALGGERHAVGGRSADRRRAAHGEHADRLRELGGRRAAKVDLLVGQPTLVEDDDGVVLEPDDPVRFELGHA